MRKVAVIDVVGLTPSLIGEHTPNLKQFMEGGHLATIEAAVPAVTTTAQSTYLTGVYPDQHGIVGNGWLFRDEMEIKFWRQSNKLVQHRKIWDEAREVAAQRGETFTVANMFWWYAMNSSADYVLTPRPMYPADGRKLPDVYSWPPELRFDMQNQLGQFPLFEFWGPNSSINSTRWIAAAAMKTVERNDPTLTLIYLPHLDYGLQRHGPDQSKIGHDLQAVDTVIGDLITFFDQRDTEIMILSEYGIVPVDTPIHLNRALRHENMIAIREELGLELLDAGMSKAFAVADHQAAHVYVNDPSQMNKVRAIIEAQPGVAEVLDKGQQQKYNLDHERSGEFVVLAEQNAWFTYYYWLDDARAPDFARTVDIHRKPGYDPVELFFNPEFRYPRVHAGRKVIQKKLGFRYLMDITPLDATLIKGSHGVRTAPEAGPLLMTRQAGLWSGSEIRAADVYGLIMQQLTEEATAPVKA